MKQAAMLYDFQCLIVHIMCVCVCVCVCVTFLLSHRLTDAERPGLCGHHHNHGIQKQPWHINIIDANLI